MLRHLKRDLICTIRSTAYESFMFWIIESGLCVSCGAEYDENYIFDSKDKIPLCEKCGSSAF